MYLEGIILTCYTQIEDNRTSSSIFHLLKGKKGIQTVHDARIFGLENFYGIYENLDKLTFDKIMDRLHQHGHIQIVSSTENNYVTTDKGMQWLEKNRQTIPFHYYNGLKYNAMAFSFFERLLLLVQTLVNSKMNHFSFIPVIDNANVISWTKAFYRHMKPSGTNKILSLIFEDLTYVLKYLKEEEADFFIDHFSGYRAYGMSSNQLATKYEMTTYDVRVLLVGIIHQILTIIGEQKVKLNMLPLILSDITTNHFITNSAHMTYKLIMEGYSIGQIANIRGLKENTINDHIVEISLFAPNFSIDHYVSFETQKEITDAVQQLQSFKLKDIKNVVSRNITYFQIRLVISNMKKTIK